MATATWWRRIVDLVTVVWLGLFLVLVAGWLGLGSPGRAVKLALRALLLVFVADVLWLYRTSDHGPSQFARTHWFYVLTVVPWFRPLRVLRAGRGLQALRALARSRLAGASLNKLRRVGNRLWPGREPE